MHQETEPALEPDEQILAAPLHGHDRVALELLCDLEYVCRPGEPRIEDPHADELPPFKTRRELRPDGLDLRKLRHQATTSSRIPGACGSSPPRAVRTRTDAAAR